MDYDDIKTGDKIAKISNTYMEFFDRISNCNVRIYVPKHEV